MTTSTALFIGGPDDLVRRTFDGAVPPLWTTTCQWSRTCGPSVPVFSWGLSSAENSLESPTIERTIYRRQTCIDPATGKNVFIFLVKSVETIQPNTVSKEDYDRVVKERDESIALARAVGAEVVRLKKNTQATISYDGGTVIEIPENAHRFVAYDLGFIHGMRREVERRESAMKVDSPAVNKVCALPDCKSCNR